MCSGTYHRIFAGVDNYKDEENRNNYYKDKDDDNDDGDNNVNDNDRDDNYDKGDGIES